MTNVNLEDKCIAVVNSINNDAQIKSAKNYLLLAIRWCENNYEYNSVDYIQGMHFNHKYGKVLNE